jgi:peptide deformylase
MAAFAAELARWRIERGMSKKQLASDMGFDPSYVSHVEGRRHRPTEDFAKRAEAVLQAGGAIWLRFTEYDELRRVPRSAASVATDQWLPPGTGLVVEDETAALSYVDGVYHATVRRQLYNAGAEPVTRYPVRVSVDRYPGDPERSNRFYREHPLTWDDLDLTASFGDPAREAMQWRPIHDRDSFKEIWLLFENGDSRFPLYRGQRAVISYSYSVREDKWGQWFQRAVRLPTRRLAVRLDFPAALAPSVWGVQTSLTSESPLRTPVVQSEHQDRTVFEWSTENPSMHARYRLEWRFRAPEPAQRSPQMDETPIDVPATVPPLAPGRASERMRAVGIVQRGAELLRQPARSFELPEQRADARAVVDQLLAALDRIDELHTFEKGLGLAAPQLGMPWAVAVVRPPDGVAEPVVLLNPKIVNSSTEGDEQYEGCLSFFDVRGLVRRPLRLEVEHERLDGGRQITAYERALARLVLHEVDHLEGKLYVDRMAPGRSLVPVEEYRDTGRPWRYNK